jgi:hypothetical protein
MDLEDVHFTPGLDPGGDAQTAYITGNGVGVAKLKPSENAGEWDLRAVPPFDFGVVAVPADDRSPAVEAAKTWLENYFRGEGRAIAEATWGDAERG